MLDSDLQWETIDAPSPQLMRNHPSLENVRGFTQDVRPARAILQG